MSEITVQLGKFKAFRGSWGSGIATLEFEDGSTVNADNGPLARALNSLGAEITAGHTLDTSPLVGLELVWYLDDMGLCLGGLIRYDEWLERGLPRLKEGVEITIRLEKYIS